MTHVGKMLRLRALTHIGEMSRFTHFARHKISAARHFQLFCTPAFGTNEKDKEVCVVYQDDDQKALLEGVDKLIVERKRDRPMWFSRAQLERVREEPSGVEGTLKPSGLV